MICFFVSVAATSMTLNRFQWRIICYCASPIHLSCAHLMFNFWPKVEIRPTEAGMDVMTKTSIHRHQSLHSFFSRQMLNFYAFGYHSWYWHQWFLTVTLIRRFDAILVCKEAIDLSIYYLLLVLIWPQPTSPIPIFGIWSDVTLHFDWHWWGAAAERRRFYKQ